MCMEDVRIGRKIHTVFEQVSVPNVGWSLIAKAVPRRVLLMFGNSSTNQASVYPANLGNAISVGFPVGDTTGGGAPVTLDIKTHGDSVTREWWGHSNGAGAILLSVLQGVLEEE